MVGESSGWSICEACAGEHLLASSDVVESNELRFPQTFGGHRVFGDELKGNALELLHDLKREEKEEGEEVMKILAGDLSVSHVST